MTKKKKVTKKATTKVVPKSKVEKIEPRESWLQLILIAAAVLILLGVSWAIVRDLVKPEPENPTAPLQEIPQYDQIEDPVVDDGQSQEIMIIPLDEAMVPDPPADEKPMLPDPPEVDEPQTEFKPAKVVEPEPPGDPQWYSDFTEEYQRRQ